MKKQVVYLNGHFKPISQAFIPLEDRGFLFGDGIFTTLRCFQGKVEFIKDHLTRITEQGRILNIQLPQLDYASIITELIHKNSAYEGLWRLKIIFSAATHLSLSLQCRPCGTQAIILERIKEPSSSPCRLCVYPEGFSKPYSHLKTLSFLERLHFYSYAQSLGYDEVIICDQAQNWIENAFSNLFWIIEDTLFTSKATTKALEGIILKNLIRTFSPHVQYVSQNITHIPSHAHFYMCNSLIHFRPITEIENVCLNRNFLLETVLEDIIQKELEKDHLEVHHLGLF